MQTKNVVEKGKSVFEVLGELPYRPGTKEYTQKIREAFKENVQSIEVNCFGLQEDHYEILEKVTVHKVRIFNEKVGQWQIVDMIEYEDLCGICGSLMLVRAIKGSTWLAFCSKKCWEKFDQLRKEDSGE